MTIKYIGMAFIFICSVLTGSGLAIAEKRSLRRSEEICELLSFISREIECFRTPLDSIYSSFKGESLEKNGFLGKVRKESLKSALMDSGNIFCFKEATFSSLVSFSDFIGKSEYSDQVSRCKYVLLQTQEDLKRSKEAYPKNRKMYSSLSILAGMMVIILIL